MKYKLFLMAFVLFGSLSCKSQEVSASITVIDQNGEKVPDAEVGVNPPASSGVPRVSGKTNAEGEVQLSLKKMPLHTAGVSKDGYYGTAKDLPFEVTYQTLSGSMQIEIKEIKNPIPLFAKWLKPLKVPVESKEVGYDFMVGDWVAPYGNGKISDMIFFYESEFEDYDNYSRNLKVRFSNEKDGLIAYEASLIRGSKLVSDYNAPEEGYLSEWIQKSSRANGGASQSTVNRKRNFYFRVRTELDEEGNIISAHYGKIYGDFMSFIYYFNPTPNDRNVEFATGKNLFRNLHWKEKVDRP